MQNLKMKKISGFAPEAEQVRSFRNQFQTLVNQSVDKQLEFFLKRYIFELGEDWQSVVGLANKFKKYTSSRNDSSDLNVTEAADFLQKNGKTRTAQERQAELKDIDLDNNGRIAFLEYLLLHFKVMVLTEFYTQKLGEPLPSEIDLSKDGVGVTGVGDIILCALFTFGKERDPEIEAAIEATMREQQEKDARMSELKATIEDVSKTQVQRMKAQHELLRLENEDTTMADAELIRLMAGRRRAQKQARNAKEKNEKVLNQNKKAEQEAIKQQKAASKSKLKNMANSFQEHGKIDESKFVNQASNRASIKAIRDRGLGLYTEKDRQDL